MFEIVITTKDRRDDLLSTLRSIRPMLSPRLHVRVYDDGSTDGTSEAVRREFPDIPLLRNEQAKGYMFCRNHLLNTCTAEYAISLDDDAHFVTEDPLEPILAHFNANPACALIGFRIFWGKSLPADVSENAFPMQVKSFVGCGHVWKMSAWREIPDYPEWLGFYGEENYASMQLFRIGWQVHYLPSVLVQHRVDLLQRRSEPDYARRMRFSLRSGWAAYFIFLPWKSVVKMMAYTEWMQLRLKVFKGDRAALKAVAQANFDLLRWLPRLIRSPYRFTAEQYRRYSRLPEAVIYWKPKKQ